MPLEITFRALSFLGLKMCVLYVAKIDDWSLMTDDLSLVMDDW